MKINLFVQSSNPGRVYLMSGERRPDKYRFERVDGTSEKRMVLTSLHQFYEVTKDMRLVSAFDPSTPIRFEVVLEDSDLNNEEAINELKAEIQRLSDENEAYSFKVAELASKLSEPTGLTDSQRGALIERDQIVTLLKPIAKKGEAPLDVIQRLADLADQEEEAQKPARGRRKKNEEE